MKSNLAIASLIAIILFLGSCNWDKTYLYGTGGDGIKDSVCFQNEILPIINSNCAKSGCHDATTMQSGYDFSNYNGIMAAVKPGNPNSSKLYEVISGGGEEAMPPPPDASLSSDQVNLIATWISQGAGYNVDCGVNVPCDTSNVTYSGTVSVIISNNCLGCHNNSGTGGGILLNTWGQVSDQAINGNLLCAINWTGCSQMPKNAAKLSSCDLTKIQIWANQGAPNN